MADANGIELKQSKPSPLSSIVAFAVDTVIVYTLALRVSGTLVSLWFAAAPHLFQISTTTRPADWYLQHLELITMIPALAAGYVDIARTVPALLGGLMKERRVTSSAIWVWTVPATVLLYKMLEYHPESSVLIGNPTPAFKYFFEIPTLATLRYGDPVRYLRQLTVTAPFYAGIAYSLGALAHRYQILVKLFSFEKPEETPPIDDGQQSRTALPSPSPEEKTAAPSASHSSSASSPQSSLSSAAASPASNNRSPL